jgi:hypothetical protein
MDRNEFLARNRTGFGEIRQALVFSAFPRPLSRLLVCRAWQGIRSATNCDDNAIRYT